MIRSNAFSLSSLVSAVVHYAEKETYREIALLLSNASIECHGANLAQIYAFQHESVEDWKSR